MTDDRTRELEEGNTEAVVGAAVQDHHGTADRSATIAPYPAELRRDMEALADRVADDIDKQFHPTKEALADVLAEMNSKYSVINWEGKVLIAQEPIDPVTGRKKFVLSSVADLKVWTRNERRVCKKSRADWWLDHEDRRQYRGVTFMPGENAPAGFFNLWKGWSVQPAEGDCSLWLQMTREVICSGNEQHYSYVLDWCADYVQNHDPNSRPGVALVLRGGQGTGKGTFARELGALCADHFLHVRNTRHVTGNFNAHMAHALLVFSDEATYPGDKAGEASLKALITEPTNAIEYKGRDVVQVQNHIRLIMASNHDWVVPAAGDDRRFAVFDVSDRYKQNEEYFGSINQQMLNGGRAALLKMLLERDISRATLRTIPTTTARTEQQMMSMEPVHAYWLGELAKTDGWQTMVKVAEAYEEYRRNAGRYPMISEQFGIVSKKLFPTLKKVRPRCEGTRVPHYQLPDLAEARAAFEKAIGRAIDWAEYEMLDTDEDAPL